MKTAVSIPDDIFSSAERFARRAKKSRSRLYSEALREYVARHSPDEITGAMNQVCKVVGNAKDSFTSSAARWSTQPGKLRSRFPPEPPNNA